MNDPKLYIEDEAIREVMAEPDTLTKYVAEAQELRSQVIRLEAEVARLRNDTHGPTGIHWRQTALERLALIEAARERDSIRAKRLNDRDKAIRVYKVTDMCAGTVDYRIGFGPRNIPSFRDEESEERAERYAERVRQWLRMWD